MVRFARTMLRLTGLMLALNMGCGGGNGPVDNTVIPVLTSTTRQASNLELTVTLPKATYVVGEAVPYTMTVKNVGTQALPVDYNDPATYPLIKQGTNIIWNSSSGVSSPRSSQLSPGQVLTFTGTWTQGDVGVAQVTPGTYTLQGWFDASAVNGVVLDGSTAAQATLYTNPVTFAIR